MNKKSRTSRSIRWITVMLFVAALVVLALLVAPVSAKVSPEVIGGLVYIDENLNGKWDSGEAGYGGEYGVSQEDNGDWSWRYWGTKVTFTSIGSGPEDPFVVESAPFREMEDEEKHGNTCTRQDLEEAVDEGFTASRPCEGTFGMISWADDVTWEVTIDVPEGYVPTSDSSLVFATGQEVPFCDFGIAPID